MDTRWADVSEHNGRAVDDTYPFRVLSFRSNDGNYQDLLFTENMRYVMSRNGRRKLRAFITYFVWRPNWQETVAVYKSRIGSFHRRRMAVMIDVERWGGQITGDHSKDIGATREDLISWLNGLRPAWQRRVLFRRYFRAQDRKRVLIYANQYDLETLDPSHGDANLIVADYDPVALDLPNMVAQQYTSKAHCAPWGYPVDMNVARNTTVRQLSRELGLGSLKWIP